MSAALPGLHVGCHVSHLSIPLVPSLLLHGAGLGEQSRPRGASGAPIKDAASRAIVAAGGTITHHHAIGRDHAPYLGDEIGEFGLGAAARGQGTLRPGRDPRSPGKLLS